MLSLRSTALVFLCPLLAHGTKPQRAVWQGYTDLAAGQCVSTQLTDDGVLAPAPEVTRLAELGANEAWSVAATPDGAILVGTAPEGKLLRVARDGSVKILAKFAESHLYAVISDGHGGAYVGTSPDGKIYQVGADGKSQIYFDPHEKYIWCLAIGPDRALYVGTGTRGGIYRVTAKGTGELWYGSNEVHIRALGFTSKGVLLAGTAESGYLLQVAGRNQGVVLAATGREEINQIQSAPDGTVYFTATGLAKDRPAIVAGKPSAGDAMSAAADAPVGNSALYRLDATLDPVQLWTTKETILSLETGAGGGAEIIGTAANGLVYALTARGEATRVCRIDSQSVTALAQVGSATILATSNPGRLFRIGEKKSAGIYESNVADSGSFARWGAIHVDATAPEAVKISTRTGNTALPDKTWYPWTPAGADGGSRSAAARFLQVQLQITAGTVDRIEAVYLPRNQPPHLESVKILPVGKGYAPAPSSPLPPSPQTAEQIFSAASQPEAKFPTHYQEQDAPGLRTLLWKASDPNGDELAYTVFWRKKGATVWTELATNITENLLTWDTSSWAEGRYELKVEASDANANPAGEAMTDAMVSREMVVSHTPPQIQITAAKEGTVDFSVQATVSILQSVTISTDGKTYRPIVPVDGILDSAHETFVAQIGPHDTLFIRAEDEGGNVAGTQTSR